MKRIFWPSFHFSKSEKEIPPANHRLHVSSLSSVLFQIQDVVEVITQNTYFAVCKFMDFHFARQRPYWRTEEDRPCWVSVSWIMIVLFELMLAGSPQRSQGYFSSNILIGQKHAHIVVFNEVFLSYYFYFLLGNNLCASWFPYFFAISLS